VVDPFLEVPFRVVVPYQVGDLACLEEDPSQVVVHYYRTVAGRMEGVLLEVLSFPVAVRAYQEGVLSFHAVVL
jgi:hypothetical protein